MRFENAKRLRVVKGQVTVSVGDEEGFLEVRKSRAKSAGGPEEPRPLFGPYDSHPERRAVAYVRANLLSQVGDTHHDVAESGRSETLELPVDEGPAGDRQHRLGHRESVRTHPRREAPCQDNRLHRETGASSSTRGCAKKNGGVDATRAAKERPLATSPARDA